MKRILLTFFGLVFLFSFGASALSNSPRLCDHADLLTDSEEQSIVNKLDSLSAKYKVDFVIATFDSINGADPKEYVGEYYDMNSYGYNASRDGVIFLITMQEREYCILSNGIAQDAISDDDIEYICDFVFNDVSRGNYKHAFYTFIEECESRINGEINGYPFDYGKSILIALAVGFVIAFIATSVMKAQLKSVKAKNFASDYVRSGSFKVTTSRDLFLYRNVDRRVKESSSSGSSSNGGSRSVGGRKF